MSSSSRPGGVDQRLHEVERAPDVEAEQRQARSGRNPAPAVGSQSRWVCQESAGRAPSMPALGDHAEPELLVDGEPAGTLVQAEAQAE